MLHAGSLTVALTVATAVTTANAYAQGTGAAARPDSNAGALTGRVGGVPLHPNHGADRLGDYPAMIVKDAEQRVIMMVAPADSGAGRDTTVGIEPSWIEAIDIIKPAAAVAALGRGFERGILIVTLTPAGSEAWRTRRARAPNARISP